MANIPGIQVKYTREEYNSFHGLTAPSFLPNIEAKNAESGIEKIKNRLSQDFQIVLEKNHLMSYSTLLSVKYSFLSGLQYNEVIF